MDRSLGNNEACDGLWGYLLPSGNTVVFETPSRQCKKLHFGLYSTATLFGVNQGVLPAAFGIFATSDPMWERSVVHQAFLPQVFGRYNVSKRD